VTSRAALTPSAQIVLFSVVQAATAQWGRGANNGGDVRIAYLGKDYST